MHFSKHLELVKCLQVSSYIFSFFPFLSTCVTSADLRHEGKVEDLIELFMLFHKNSEKNINIFVYHLGRDIRNLRCLIYFQVMNFFFNTYHNPFLQKQILFSSCNCFELQECLGGLCILE